MPTNQNAYNSRVTDEALEKRFRDTFRSQGGAELVDDLYASGVIVPVVDFTAAATGQQLEQNLQTAWDFTTGQDTVAGTTTTVISNAGFWQVDLIYSGFISGSVADAANVSITDGLSTKKVWNFAQSGATAAVDSVVESSFVVFLRSGDSLTASTVNTNYVLSLWYRQIATLNGDLVNPSGFTSS